jgi:hypothetical protein
MHVALRQEAPSVLQRFLRRHLVAHEGHIADQVRASCAARHRTRVIDHLVERDRQRGVEALDDVSKRVSDQQNVCAAFIQHARKRGVVGSDHHEALPASSERA